ncbi:MAG: MauE/DoxX family redox-associated membrane protein [Candidatus Nanohaloarchaea archaeon]|nr:MauE/DoxX family redox-associated membrane protein [Candidatus Nanohaloarchaea archaeon]
MTGTQPVLQSLARFVLGGIFLWSGGVKLPDLEGFGLIASTYSIVPGFLSRPVRYTAYLVPFTELLAGALLILWELPVYALMFTGASLVGYSVLEVHELVSPGTQENCGCYGTAIEVELSWWQVAKNVVLLGLTAFLLAPFLM